MLTLMVIYNGRAAVFLGTAAAFLMMILFSCLGCAEKASRDPLLTKIYFDEVFFSVRAQEAFFGENSEC